MKKDKFEKYVKHFCELFEKKEIITYLDIEQGLCITAPTRKKVVAYLLKRKFITLQKSLDKTKYFMVIR